jgi:hypothetical protein
VSHTLPCSRRVRRRCCSCPGLLQVERQRRGTRAGRRALGCFTQAVLVLRWFLDGTRVAQLAADNAIGGSTAYRYLHEGIDVLAARRPTLHSALLAAKAAGYSHVNLDGTLVATDRVAAPGPTPGVDLWVVGQASPPRRQHPGHLRPRRLAIVDFRRATRP